MAWGAGIVKSITIDPSNGICGIIFVAIGAFFAVQARELGIGTALQMGSGYFPMLLSIILIGLGLVLLARSLRVEEESVGPIAVRGILLIVPAPILFGLTVNGLGFLPSLFLTCLVACFASIRMTVVMALTVSCAITAFSAVVFSYALGLPYPLLGPWLTFQ